MHLAALSGCAAPSAPPRQHPSGKYRVRNIRNPNGVPHWMARYFFHLREPGDYIRDEEGAELPDLDAAHAHALENVRDIISMEVRGGVIPLSHVMEIADATGNVVRRISYVEAVRIT